MGLAPRGRRIRGTALGLLVLSLAAATVIFPADGAGAAGPQVQKDITFENVDGLAVKLDAYVPQGNGPRPAILVIHGGGFANGDKSTLAPQCSYLAENTGFAVFSMNYRLAPQSRYPAQLQDSERALEWIRQNAAQYGVDPNRIGALGDSVGGNLATLLGTLGQGPRDQGFRVAAVVSWSGPMNLTTPVTRAGGQGFLFRYFGFGYQQNPQVYREASPYFQVDPTDAPTYLFNSTQELVREDQATSMADRLQQAGVPHQLTIYPGGQHAEHYSDKSLPPTVTFFKKYLAKGTSSGSSSPSSPSSPLPTGTGNASGGQHRNGSGAGTALLIGLAVVGAAALVIGGVLIGSRRGSRRPPTPTG